MNGDLEKLRKKSTQDARRINNLDAQRTQLQLRLKDQDEERRGKAKLLDVWMSNILPWVPLSLTFLRTYKTNWRL